MVVRQRRTYYNNDRCPPGWVWLLSGILIGVFLSFLFYLQEIAPYTLQAQKSPPPPVVTENATKKPTTSTAETAQKPPRFEFYDLLPNTEAKFPKATLPKAESPPPRTEPVKVPTVAPNLNTASPNSTATSESVSGPHILQIGSFREEGEAEGLKAHLALLGIQANIQRLAITGTDEVWYRVRVGPFTDMNQMNQVRAQLTANNLSAIVLKF